MTIKTPPNFNVPGLGVDPLTQRIKEKEKQWKYKVAVLSGKGGVGKSTVAVNLAVALAKQGYFVGVLDADVHGPNVAKMLGVEKAEVLAEKFEDGHFEMIPPMNDFSGQTTPIKVMSMGLMVPEDQPIIWRGSLVTKAIKQLLGDVKWGSLDFMIVDFPPGTGDQILTVAQTIQLDAAIIVTTPQEVALLDTGKAVNMMKQMGIPYVAVVENMSYLICPHCGNKIDLFGEGGGEKLAEKMGVDFLGKVPIDLKAREASDSGMPIVLYEDTPAAKAFMGIAQKLVAKLEELKKEE
ncbi:MAG: ATP-binding protein involved in chromosome partitioning [Thermococcaceae archaeon]|uniref:Mrp/NBP35 family ATP-binding protein n=1 Tax=Thermococcus TaxID=2263 RepID=UPI00128C94C9|nr:MULTISPECIES: Mrp/NBP35 family ATP-binding protein [Thermococcus]MDK2783817.1 ATP-binding protein involved in chromosome partitioning [Thermococcaceae archaeon]MCA6214335.1 Mrp/NBP35 family ATP-binding protein [Thermococcus bergensis]MDK2983057.1 ATP-binding protein involved in chromosome partitioning [Thermococcaceae archaeon]MDN5320487.1 ATP-binding protein involved in chromosome partitioning [Thermococcaceae archaeon]MPW39264.1 P-loop NTPase [Thermococcus sp. 101 C5]